MTQLDQNQGQDQQPPPKERLLQQVHPPPRTDDATTPASEAIQNIHLLNQAGDYWEGFCRLNDGNTVPFQAHRVGRQVHLWLGGEMYVFSPLIPASHRRAYQQTSTDEVLCTMPGVVLAVHVAAGDTVEAGQDLLTMESMKTEQVVKSPRDGTVQRVAVQPGDRADRGMRLVLLVPLEAD